jgi:hypothetical protein
MTSQSVIFLISKSRVDTKTSTSIDWDSIGKAIKESPFRKRALIPKHVMGMCIISTGKNVTIPIAHAVEPSNMPDTYGFVKELTFLPYGTHLNYGTW